MKRLRTYSSMRRVSKKVERERGDFDKVYDLVDQRSEGRCEFTYLIDKGMLATARCRARATDHHHLMKPRRTFHDPALVVHLCRSHHDRCEWPYDRGRLSISLVGGRFFFKIIYAANKFSFTVRDAEVGDGQTV